MAFDTQKNSSGQADDLNFHTDMPVGEILRRTRNHYGQSLQQVEVVLRIRASHLEALETGDISKLPGRVYAIGFVRSYSEYLGLDGDKMVHLFKEQSVGKKAKPDLSFPVAASESKVPSMMIVGGSVFGIVVLIVFLWLVFLPHKQKNEIPEVPESLTKSQLNQAPALLGTSEQKSVEAGNGAANQASAVSSGSGEGQVATPKPANRIVLEITDASWIEIRNAKGDPILRQVLKTGDVYMVPDEPGLVMATGNAGGIQLKLDGKPLPSLGSQGEIRRKIPLNPDLLSSGKIR